MKTCPLGKIRIDPYEDRDREEIVNFKDACGWDVQLIWDTANRIFWLEVTNLKTRSTGLEMDKIKELRDTLNNIIERGTMEDH